jgi:hypothetical protein
VHVLNIENIFGKSISADYATTVGWIDANDCLNNTIITRRVSPNNKNTNHFHVDFNDPRFLHQTFGTMSTNTFLKRFQPRCVSRPIRTPNQNNVPSTYRNGISSMGQSIFAINDNKQRDGTISIVGRWLRSWFVAMEMKVQFRLMTF